MRRSIDAHDSESARSAAVALLSRRDYTSQQLRTRLERKGFDPTVVQGTIDELTEDRTLDDVRYAANYVGSHAERGEGPVRIAAHLKVLGLAAELVDAAVAAGPDWRVLANEVLLRKFGPEQPADGTEKARQARFLQYRGFSLDHIRSALGVDFDLD